MPMPTFPLAPPGGVRSELHACCNRRADALFELCEALLCAPAIPSLPHLSLEPVHQRGWGSVYAALARGRIDTEQLRDLLVRFLPPADPLVFAVDVTTCRAATPSARPSGATTTTPRGIRPASRPARIAHRRGGCSRRAARSESRRAAPGGRLASAWPHSLPASPLTGNLSSTNDPAGLNHKLRHMSGTMF